ncbi:MAG: DUF2460 domain-containing protein [Ignavibacteria bacterium]|nr:DUF2460 domain-containing protein [Ignavibacteria bacterium]MCU7505039.1 DUF2460 domain-containing protein [Ignavibacteria bacterium]MCU7515321.1 DUF2460 domain-containing protein [Ignavibacteria bacterium]
MKLIVKYLYFLIIIFCAGNKLFAQENYSTYVVTDTIQVNLRNIYPLSSLSIVPFSEIIKFRGNILKSGEYRVSYPKAYFTLSDSLHASLLDTIIITYRSYRTTLKKEYKRRTLETRIEKDSKDTLRVLKTENAIFSPESIFGRDLQKSGTLVRGFTVGTTRDLTLNSGLRLQLSGKLSENIEIVAALSDENIPIQPEGNTERLDELDKVFIELRHPNATGTFGDYEISEKIGEFGTVQRKLQGLKSELNFGNYKGSIAIANSKGKFNSNQFIGGEGVQGPYQLSGVNNEKEIIVIAGSERVYVDGEVMKRGENNDYTIDYSTAQVTFTPKRLITSESRITIDFEYSDRRFARSFFGSSFQTSQLDKKLNVSLGFFREGDNQDAPIDVSISETDRKILELAGSDRNLASKSGVQLAAPDSAGNIRGVYSSVDTLVNGKPYTYYVYDPGKGLYNVTFSFTGASRGDYIKESLGKYRFAGIGKGSYMPIVFLPMPELRQMGNMVVEYLPYKDVSLSLELSGSILDQNRFSTLDNTDNFGTARNLFFQLKPREIKLFGKNLGNFGLNYKDRYIQKEYTSLDRINAVEFDRNYNIPEIANNRDETLREAGLNYELGKTLKADFMYGHLKREGVLSSDRYLSNLTFSDQESYNAEYHLDYVKSNNPLSNSSWLRQSARSYYILWNKVKPAIDYVSEKNNDNSALQDSALFGSTNYSEVTPSLEFMNIGGFNFQTQYSFRVDRSPLFGVMEREAKSFTQSYNLSYRGLKDFNSTLSFVLRDKKYTPIFKSKGFSDNQTILVRSQSRLSLWNQAVTGDLFYEGSTQRTSRLQRVFLKVPQGTGSYKYLGDLNKNGIADEDEFELTLYDGDYVVTTLPTDQLFPVVDLKVNSRWKVNLGRLFKKNTLAGFFLSPVSSETFLRIEENSTETDFKKIYLLHLSSFLNDSTTIRGSNLFQQDFFLFENSSELSFRFRYMQTKNLYQYSGGLERGYNRERSLRIQMKLIEEISNQTDVINSTDNLISMGSFNRSRMLSANSISTDFSYRPIKSVEAGFKLTFGRTQDNLPRTPTVIDQNAQVLRLTLSFAGTGRMRLEFERNELLPNTLLNYIPFEMTKGNFIGKNYFWRYNFDYRFTGNLQSTIGYEGRQQGKGKVVHTARAELRAFF